ncbi:MAG: hypothetical protein LBU82_08295 [Treponema sp.]|jgi:uncharacterized membrane protein HdeD (DUF308 family)|nr:hypothetical protein [Treponema sp.]
MIQLYFLSILCNAASGYIFFRGGGEAGESVEKSMKFSAENPVFILVLGVLSIIVGVLKLLSPFDNRYPFFGDLAPAIAGVAAGLFLIFGVNPRAESSAFHDKTLESLGEKLPRVRKPLGLGLLACALLHFLLPQALFL